MGLNYNASSSPTLVLTPSQQHQAHFFGNHYQDHSLHNQSIMNAGALSSPADAMTDLPTSNPTSTNTTDATAVNRKPVRPRFPKPPSINYLATCSSLSGRKRSFADVHEDEPYEDADGSYVSPATENPPSPPKPRGEPVFGPGMTLVYPEDPQFNIAAESQTGTWAEEKISAEAANAVRPVIISRKSQRLVQPESIAVDVPSSMSVTYGINGTSPTSADPPIDHLSMILGIGWKRIPSSQAPAAKGWEKYILNHYSNILDPAILLHNEGMRVYLVRTLSATNDTQECWWLFQETLSACCLVGFCEADAIRSLQKGETMGPTVFAHNESRHRSMSSAEPIASMDQPFAAIQPISGNDVEMEM